CDFDQNGPKARVLSGWHVLGEVPMAFFSLALAVLAAGGDGQVPQGLRSKDPSCTRTRERYTTYASPVRGFPHADSTEPAIDLGQELGKVEVHWAGLMRRVEVSAVPVALLFGELGIGIPGPAAGTMMLMVGQEPGQIAQPRDGPRGALAPAVAGGAQHR